MVKAGVDPLPKRLDPDPKLGAVPKILAVFPVPNGVVAKAAAGKLERFEEELPKAAKFDPNNDVVDDDFEGVSGAVVVVVVVDVVVVVFVESAEAGTAFSIGFSVVKLVFSGSDVLACFFVGFIAGLSVDSVVVVVVVKVGFGSSFFAEVVV